MSIGVAERLFAWTFGAEVADIWRRRLARGVVGVLAVRVIATLLSLITGIVLARALRVQGYGTYVFALAWARVLAVPATLGQDRLLVREVAAYEARQDWSRLRGLFEWSTLTTLAASLALAVLSAAVVRITGWWRSDVAAAVYVALLLVPLLSLTRLRQGALQGLHRVVAGAIPESILAPSVFLVLVVVLWRGYGVHLSPADAVAFTLVGTAVALAAAAWNLRRQLPGPVRSATALREPAVWWRSGLPLMFLSAMTVAATQLDVLMLGVLRGPAAAGVFRVADRGAELVVFVSVVLNAAVAPAMSRLFAEGRLDDLQRLVTRSARAVILCALPVAATLIVFGRQFLLLFGPEFPLGWTALVVLALAQLVGAFAGTINTVLIMTGNERIVAVTVGAGTLLNGLLNVVMIPRWGPLGAAWATLVSLTMIKVTLVVAAWRRTGLVTTGLAPLGRRVGARS